MATLLGAIRSTDSIKSVYDQLEKGDRVIIKYGSAITRDNEKKFIVTKGKTTVGKLKVERIALVLESNPKGVKYYLYNRGGKISFAIGDMAGSLESIKKV
jgi:hypothetical protein